MAWPLAVLAVAGRVAMVAARGAGSAAAGGSRAAAGGAAKSMATSAAEAAGAGPRTSRVVGNVAKQATMYQKPSGGGNEPRNQNFSQGSGNGGGDVFGAYSG